MAQTTGMIEGLDIEEFDDADTREDDIDPIAQKFLDGFRQYQQGNYKAAAAYGVDAVNMIASEFGVHCGASL